MPATRTLFRLILLVGFVSLVGVTSAQQQSETANFPTVTALESASLPVRNRIDLARRFLGITDIAAPPDSPPAYHLGDQEMFWVDDVAQDRSFQVNATLRAIGDHIYLWVEDGAQVNGDDLRALADGFDKHIYDQVRALWGSEAIPGIDGDPHVYGLFASGIGGTTLAYFASTHSYPAEVVHNSNEHEMFIFNLDNVYWDLTELESVTAHEFQHMIRSNIDGNEDSWLDEGASTFTELYLGHEAEWWSGTVFLQAPGTQLNAWTEEGSRTADYGAALLFMTYFYERYGLDAVKTLSENPANGLISVDEVLREMGEPGVNDLFADWVLANFFLSHKLDDGRYGYAEFPVNMSGLTAHTRIDHYPDLITGKVNQYAADYYVLDNLEGGSTMEVSFAAPATVQLVPTSAYSGDWMWYSNRGDESDTTLTHAFDLTGTDQATLSYRAWYHTENLWDYAHVMVSTDNGLTWTILSSPNMTTDNPHHNAYGPGYTGSSGGWIKEVIPLDDYVGQQILVRFEMITDDAVNQPGIVIDDVGIAEIGYFSDFETDDGGWDAAGWIRIDNILPQDTWVQVAQRSGSDVNLTRWQAIGSQKWTLPLDDNVDQVVLVISPFAPVTTVPMPYTLNVDVR